MSLNSTMSAQPTSSEPILTTTQPPSTTTVPPTTTVEPTTTLVPTTTIATTTSSEVVPTTTTTDTTTPATTSAPESTTTPPTSTTIISSSPIVTVSSSGTHIVTYTSYSTTHVPTIISPTGTPDPDNTNKGAIIGGVVGGVAFLVIAGVAAFLLLRRRRRGTGESQRNSMNAGPNFDYNPYTSPTMIASSDNNSFSTGRPLSMSTVPSAKPRPLVQAYNPGLEEGVYQQQQHEQQYYPEYQHYDPYYSQQEPMMLPHRNVPDEADYNKPERHVPDEVPQQQK